MRYGNLIYNKRNGRLNLGDDIQILAVENMYREMHVNYRDVVRIEFSDLYIWDGEELIVPISFPIISYSNQMCITCFSEKIRPVFLALSILAESLNEKDVEYLIRFSPIGCRDHHTYMIMKRYHIPAYLFGCMTMTFPKVWKEDINKKKVFCVDVSDKLAVNIPDKIRGKCVFLSNAYDISEINGSPEKKAREMYDLFINEAEMVITARMHVALPCFAAGIPTIFAKDLYSYRFEGVNRIFNIYSEDEYASIDWNVRPIDYGQLKKKMLELAISRVSGKDEAGRIIEQYNHLFVGKKMRKGVIESVYNTENYLKRIPHDEPFEYIIWSLTQTADLIYDMIGKKWKNGKLVAVVDRSKRVDFHGMLSCSKEIILHHKKAIILVCSDAAIAEAEEYFRKYQINDYFYCCQNGMLI